jgi:molecular chaperone IbpA
MGTYDFSPLYRSTVGFDRLFDMLDRVTEPQTHWPPYNIERKGEDQYFITMAVAGFAPDEIEIVQQENTLLVTGGKRSEPQDVECLYRGIANGSFRQSFNLADHVKVVAAALDNGLLKIELMREVPEELKPRQIKIESTGAIHRDNVQQIGGPKAA